MGRIMKIAAVENANAIWEYDPDLPDNHLSGGTLDHIAALRTVIIKVCCTCCIDNRDIVVIWTYIVDQCLPSEDRVF
jgi:hypothetical protein